MTLQCFVYKWKIWSVMHWIRYPASSVYVNSNLDLVTTSLMCSRLTLYEKSYVTNLKISLFSFCYLQGLFHSQ
ncbi:unnamed protein product [Blepharisma stoltei]|uniref:Uncharacterized protein n=1 Tax=Blepharisma stoltei TaxID=1481888 RepID=A0AAU9JSZ9_9CILI|nr:unnamed protein product [Blepharisma stoltei]